MNIHHDSFFSVCLEAPFDVHHYSYSIFPSTGTLLPDTKEERYCATHSHTAGLTRTNNQSKYYWCSFLSVTITCKTNIGETKEVNYYTHTERTQQRMKTVYRNCKCLPTLDGGFVVENQSLSVAWMHSRSWNIKQKNIKLNLHLTSTFFLARITETQLKLNSFLLSADSTSTSGQLWYAAPPTDGSQCVINIEIRKKWLKAWDIERRKVKFNFWWKSYFKT